MNKKILLVSILAVFMLVAISYAAAVDTNTANTKRKESPLYKIRTGKAIAEKITNIIENIRTKFLGERIFFLPFQWMRNAEFSIRDRFLKEYTEVVTGCIPCTVNTGSCC